MATQIPRHFPGLSNRALLSPHRSGSQNYWNLTHVFVIRSHRDSSISQCGVQLLLLHFLLLLLPAAALPAVAECDPQRRQQPYNSTVQTATTLLHTTVYYTHYYALRQRRESSNTPHSLLLVKEPRDILACTRRRVPAMGNSASAVQPDSGLTENMFRFEEPKPRRPLEGLIRRSVSSVQHSMDALDRFLWGAGSKEEGITKDRSFSREHSPTEAMEEPTPVAQSKLITGLRWRRAVKSFSPTEKFLFDISPILEAISLAPSSFGSTPYKVYVITDTVKKKRLRIAASSQAQVEEASVLLFFVALTNSKIVANRIIQAMHYDISSPQIAMKIRSTYENMNKDEFVADAKAQAYIALGIALAVAAEMHIASCPIDDFNVTSVSSILKLSYFERPVVCLALGQENSDPSKSTPYGKFRFPEDQVIVFADEP